MKRATIGLLFIFLSLSLLPFFSLAERVVKSYETDRLDAYIKRAQVFSEMYPREKVSVHLDNTVYYRGERVWFQCYIVDALNNTPTNLSKTLYAELLTPKGKVVERQILKISNGRCHGVFNLTHLPFYAGYYEIRAYTKYLLNFGETAVFSRVIPIFNMPRKQGDFSDQHLKVNVSNYPGSRESTSPGKKISMRFFPEGGRLISGVKGRVAFELTGRNGRPLSGNGYIIDSSTDSVINRFETLHEGRGWFEFTPKENRDYTAVVSTDADGESKFQLPKTQNSGVGLSVDNLSREDSIIITIRPERDDMMPQVAGIAVRICGALWSYGFVKLNKERVVTFSSREMPSGVAVISVFGDDGRTFAERMIFVNNGCFGEIDKKLIEPGKTDGREMVVELLSRKEDGSVASDVSLSVSITDGNNSPTNGSDLLSDLLLSSEIKGYVRNPVQYFDNNSEENRLNLDLLMMVSGWRSYSWEEIVSVENQKIEYQPEQAIDIEGKIATLIKGTPVANADVALMVTKRNDTDSSRISFTDLVTTDSCGRFHLSHDIVGKWDLVMSVSEKGKKKDHKIMLERQFSPEPRRYEPGEISLYFPDSDVKTIPTEDRVKTDAESEDSEALLLEEASSNKYIKLKEVTIKGKRNKESEKYKVRSKALEHYDMYEELGNLSDAGKIVGKDIFDVLKNINPEFYRVYDQGTEILKYKGRKPLFVIDYKRSYYADSLNYQLIYPEDIESIYISEDPRSMMNYADPTVFTMMDIDATYGCAVFIETSPSKKGPAGRGTRHQRMEGYTMPEEFINVEDESMLDEPDVRRTLYWNPEIRTDKEGKAAIRFFRTDSCKNIKFSIQGMDDSGTIFHCR